MLPIYKPVKKAKVVLYDKKQKQIWQDKINYLEQTWQNIKFDSDSSINWSEIKEYYIRRISFENSKLSLRSLTKTSFPDLKCLIISSNGIQSLESLCLIDMPHLEYLDICISRIIQASNYLTSLTSFRKCYYPQLDYLIISDNKFISNNFWSLSQLYCPETRAIIARGMLQYFDLNLNPYVCFIHLESPHLNRIQLGSFPNFKIAYVLQRKYPNVRCG